MSYPDPPFADGPPWGDDDYFRTPVDGWAGYCLGGPFAGQCRACSTDKMMVATMPRPWRFLDADPSPRFDTGKPYRTGAYVWDWEKEAWTWDGSEFGV